MLQFIERNLYLVSLGPRHREFSVLSDTRIDVAAARRLALATHNCWDAIRAFDLPGFGQYVRESFEAQIAMFPNMVVPGLYELIDTYRDVALGWKLSGAGGGGYLILVSEVEADKIVRSTTLSRS